MSAVSPLQKGEITEIVGGLSSGRTSLLLAALATATRQGGVAALVDAEDSFDVASAQRAGVDLRRVLWVRCARCYRAAVTVTDLLVHCPGFAVVALDLGQGAVRIPAALAFRLRLAARRAAVAVLIGARERTVGSTASLAIRAAQHALEWSGPGPVTTRLSRLGTELEILRARGLACPERLELARLVWWNA